jgi:hypothetical protein
MLPLFSSPLSSSRHKVKPNEQPVQPSCIGIKSAGARLLCFAASAVALVLPAHSQTFNVNNLKIRVGRPLIARNPDNFCQSSPSTMDNPFNEIQISSSSFYGYTAKSNGCNNNSSYRIDGSTPWSMRGTLNVVLTKNNTSWDQCGEWMNDTALSGTTAYGFVHAETACNYSNHGQTHKSMGLAVSSNSGQSFTIQPAQIIAEPNDVNDRCPTTQSACGTETGEGDCTSVSDGPYYYLYCAKPVPNHPRQTFVARALVSNPYPGNWDKYQNSAWTQPGVGGTFTEITSSLGSTTVHNIGQSSSVWNSNVMILGTESFAVVGGLVMSFSAMPATYSGTPKFTTLAEPLLHMDAYAYGRPSPFELIAYPSALSNTTGSHDLSNHFLLFYTYTEPDYFSAPQDRYLVTRDVYFTLETSAQSPQVGVALSRWYGVPTYGPYNGASAYWSTTAEVPGAYSTFAYQGDFGYLMTKALAGTTKLVECAASWPNTHLDHLVTAMSCDSGYSTLRTLGWVYSSSVANTKPVYRCYDSVIASHFVSNDPGCETKTTEKPIPLGYVLAN